METYLEESSSTTVTQHSVVALSDLALKIKLDKDNVKTYLVGFRHGLNVERD